MAADSQNADNTVNSEIILFTQIEEYPWKSDEEFQNGLRAILGTSSSPEQVEQLTLRAKCFYYSRKYDTVIDFTTYQDWCRRRGPIPSVMNGVIQGPTSQSVETLPVSATPKSPSSIASTSDQAAPYPMSFNHIVSLISSGEPIPGIKEIPDTILDGQASEATFEKRKKPWEKSSVDNG